MCRPSTLVLTSGAGALESCVAPILILLVSMFYTKREQARRISWFYFMVNHNVFAVTGSS